MVTLMEFLSHYYYIDGTAYDADTFGETDATTGEWKLKLLQQLQWEQMDLQF